MGSDADHWQELQELFNRLEGMSLAEREPALQRHCADPRMRTRVRQLLEAAAAMDATAPAGRPREACIGPYRLVREIGAGGIGTVYLATRQVDDVLLRSALKVLARHAVDAGFVERFHREQQHLAALDHPNITRLLDAGWTEDGQPFLVMEYVEGSHLDEYCNSRGLGIEARLRLFLQICDAVGEAHRNLIVHLDLKPSNVLVTAAGSVKLLDFGTSKLIRPDGTMTATVMVTPAYASPEQILNRPVGTGSDIYALGALLAELLSGHAPFGNVSAAGRVESASREVEPADIATAADAAAAAQRGLTLARLRQALHGDLAAIVAVCLRPRQRDRYLTVEALAADIRRHLATEPVTARRNTLRYRTGKFLRRRRGPLAVAAVLLIVAVTGLAFAWRQEHQILLEAERSARMQALMSSLFKMANPDYTGKPIATVPEFLRAGMTSLPKFLHDPADLRQGQLGLAISMYQSGSLDDARAALGAIITAATGADAQAVKAEAEAYAGDIEIRKGNMDAGRRLLADAFRLARASDAPARVRILTAVYFAYDEDDSGFRADENLRILESAAQEARRIHLGAAETAFVLNSLGADLSLRGRDAEATQIFRELLALYALDPLAVCDRSATYAWLGWLADKSDDPTSSLPLFRQAYDGYVECSGADSHGALDQLPYWGDALVKTGRAAEAVRLLENALPTWRRVARTDPESSAMLLFLGRAYNATGQFAKGASLGMEMLAFLDGKVAHDDRSFGQAELLVGEALAGERRLREAEPHARRAYGILSKNVVSAYARALRAESASLVQTVAAQR